MHILCPQRYILTVPIVLDALPTLNEINTTNAGLIDKVMAGHMGQSWYDTSRLADCDRLLKSILDVWLFLDKAKQATTATEVDHAYLNKESFYKDTCFDLIGKDFWTKRNIPIQEEMEHIYMVFNHAKVGAHHAIGHWCNTANTGTTRNLALLTEYTEGRILDTKVWEQSFNDIFLLGLIKGSGLVRFVSLLTPHTCKVRHG